MTTAVKRACDACHRRKVKCDGINPCRNCSASQLSCTYNAIPQKKGPKGSRAKVISELRETQRQTSLSAKVQNRLNGMNGPPTTPSLAPTPGLLTSEMVKECVDFFFANMYPIIPILHRQRLEQQALYMDQSLDTYCLLTSLCAFTMMQPGMNMPGGDPYSFDNIPGASMVTATLLMEETIRVRKGYDHADTPTLNSLCTSYFLFACFYALDMHEKAWYHLRDATTLAHLIGLNKEDTYVQFDNIEASRRRRLYWMLFVTERTYALQRHRPLTLQATINPPSPSDDPADPLAHQLSGFIHLVNVFRPFDDALIAQWNRARADCSPQFLSGLQKQLQEVLPSYLNNKEAQLAESQLNQQWLKHMTWQIGVAQGNITPSNELQFSIDIARDLLPIVSNFPTPNLGLAGIGLMEKLFEVSCSLADYLPMQAPARDIYTVGPREHLHGILNILTVLRSGDHRYLPLLLSKVHDVLPRLTNPMLQNAPENACSVDIFDGFGNGGMAGPTVYSDDYENKFSIPKMEDLGNESSTSSGGSSGPVHEMNSPFVSSPSMMSPGVETSHSMPPNGLPSDFGSMSEMVMSPIGNGPAPTIGTPTPLASQQGQHPHLSHQHPQAPQHAHQQHHSVSGFAPMNPPVPHALGSNISHHQGMSLASQNMGPGMAQGLGISPHMSQGISPTMGQTIPRQVLQRANSFATQVGAPAHIRTVADFQALQRANSDISTMGSLNMSPMGAELDFNTLR